VHIKFWSEPNATIGTAGRKTEGRLSNEFWIDRKTQMYQVLSWLADRARVEQLELGFFQYYLDDDVMSEQISRAIELLR